MLPLTPSSFWQVLMGELEASGSHQAYQTDSTWTPVIEEATRVACARFGYETVGEYLKIDRIAYSYGPAKLDNDWNLHIAIEYENNHDWLRELNKLAFIAADLRVLIAYQLSNERNAEETLRPYLKNHSSRVWKTPQPWLIVFGPHWDLLKTDEWRPYTISKSCELIPLECEKKLLGTCWDI